MKCKLCGTEIHLVPSASERAARYGGSPQDYTKLFTAHSFCVVAERSRQTLEFIEKRNNQDAEKRVRIRKQ